MPSIYFAIIIYKVNPISYKSTIREICLYIHNQALYVASMFFSQWKGGRDGLEILLAHGGDDPILGLLQVSACIYTNTCI